MMFGLRLDSDKRRRYRSGGRPSDLLRPDDGLHVHISCWRPSPTVVWTSSSCDDGDRQRKMQPDSYVHSSRRRLNGIIDEMRACCRSWHVPMGTHPACPVPARQPQGSGLQTPQSTGSNDAALQRQCSMISRGQDKFRSCSTSSASGRYLYDLLFLQMICF